ncbi:MAG: rane protein of unknown function [Candidatus Krumholzibacteriota bacterium]|nr:rane protein of unknown function [Candidatus Krumholzibacteriota bacterium]
MQPLNLNFLVIRRVLLRYILVWVADAASIAAAATVLPNVYFRRDIPHWYFDPFVVALLLGLLNALVRPVLIVLLLPITFVTLGLATLAFNAALFYAAHFVVESFVIEGFPAAVAGVLVLTLVNTFLGNVLRLSDDYSFYAVIMDKFSRMMRRSAAEPADRGIVILQIDGLSYAALKRALRKGRMPFVNDLVKRRRYALRRYFSGLPSQTSSVQAGLFYGDGYDIPGFRWYDKKQARLVVSSNASDMSAVDERLAARAKSLLESGACINSLLHGGAAKRFLTLSSYEDRDFKKHRAELEDFAIFSLHPYLYIRTMFFVIGDFIADRLQATIDIIGRSRTRIRRSVKFSFLRAIGNAGFREGATYFAREELVRGTPVIYANYVGYDMVAHHAGPFSADSLGVLSRIDRQIRKISRTMTKKAPRRYDLIVLADHGQTPSVPFRTLYGKSLSDFIGETIQTPSSEALGTSVELGYFRTLVRELRRADEAYGKRTLRTQRRTLERIDDKMSRGEADGKIGESFVVCASGNLAHVYLTRTPERLTTERLLEEHSALVEALIAHPGIGFVMTARENGEILVMGKTGARRLPSGGTEGADPLLPYLGGKDDDAVIAALTRLGGFPHSGDLIVNGGLLKKDVVVTFEDQVGTHGGLGGAQTEPFILYPRRLKATPDRLSDPSKIHAYLSELLAQGSSRDED